MGCGASLAQVVPDEPLPAVDLTAPLALDAGAIFTALDVDASGSVSKEELTAYLKDRGKRSQEEIDALYKVLDRNNDGAVTQEEVDQAIAEMASGNLPLEDLMAERPAPASVFDELRTNPKTKQLKAPANIKLTEERAISLDQLTAAFKHAAFRCHREGWLSKRPAADGKWGFQKINHTMINLYDLCSHVIMPATKCAALSGEGTDEAIYPSYVELVADGPQPPDFFVSHFWGEPVYEFINCLRQHTIDREVGGGVCGRYVDQFKGGPTFNWATYDGTKPWEPTAFPHKNFRQYPKPGGAAKYWVCAYANRQWNLGSDLTEDPSKTSFNKAISRSQGTVAIVDKDGKYWSRIWCDYEVYRALEGEHGRKYTFDVYTATPGKTDQVSKLHANLQPLRKEAVGLLDGPCAADQMAMQKSQASLMKLRREADFPFSKMMQGMDVQLQKGEATMEADKIHIKNAICGQTADFNAPPPEEHEAYDKVNAKLAGRMAAYSFARACFTQDTAAAEKAIAAIGHPDSRLTELRIDFGTLNPAGKGNPGDQKETPAIRALLEKLIAQLPPTLEVLHIEFTPDLHDLPGLSSRCPVLRDLSLQVCTNLKSVDFPPTLKRLNLRSCPLLKKNPPDVKGLSLEHYKEPTTIIDGWMLDSILDMVITGDQLKGIQMTVKSDSEDISELLAIMKKDHPWKYKVIDAQIQIVLKPQMSMAAKGSNKMDPMDGKIQFEK